MTEPTDTDTRFDVHLFAVVRVKVPNLQATCHADAIQQAVQQSWDSLHRRFQSDDSEFADEFSYYLVDVVADDDYRQSRGFFEKADPRSTLLARLVDWYDADQSNDDLLEAIIVSARQIINESA